MDDNVVRLHPIPEDASRVSNGYSGPRLFPVVTLCGSTRFKKEYLEVQRRYTLNGWIVLSVGCFGHADGEESSKGTKLMLDSMHLRKIDMADRIHVINPGKYIGHSTKREIEYASATDKIIVFEVDPHGPDEKRA